VFKARLLTPRCARAKPSRVQQGLTIDTPRSHDMREALPLPDPADAVMPYLTRPISTPFHQCGTHHLVEQPLVPALGFPFPLLRPRHEEQLCHTTAALSRERSVHLL
jgi:hypothetical protein